jgi:sulfopyruvate decarboxylase alpha subunit
MALDTAVPRPAAHSVKSHKSHDIHNGPDVVASTMNDMQTRVATWHEIVLATLKSNNVKLVVYVPDKVFTPLIKALHSDAFFTTFACTREEEAIGIVTGAWMGGLRAAVLMQTSGFATIPNALASLVVPSQIPALIFVSERGTLGEFNLGQAMVCKTMRPVLASLGIESHTITRHDELAFIVDRSIKQAIATQAPVTFILSPLLTGGKVFEA